MIDQIIQLFFGLLFFVTPIIMAKDTSELFEFNKMLFIYTATIVIGSLWLFKMIANKKIILKKTPLDIPIVVFFLSQLVATVFSLDHHTSIFGYYGRFNGGLISTLSYIVLYYAFVSNKISLEKILKTILASSAFVILWAVPGKLGHDLTCLLFTGKFNNACWDNSVLAFRPELRAFSTLGQPNWLGAYLSITFFVGIYFLLKNKKLNFAPVYLFLNFSMILFTRSRSALIAVLMGLILFAGYYLLSIKTNVKKILLILFLVTVFPIIFFKTGIDKVDKYLSLSTYENIFLKKQNNIVIKPTVSSQLTDITESFDIRKIVWQGAWNLGLKYPLFGTGVETFAFSYNFVRPISHNLTSEWDYVYNKAHNEYLNYLATTGFIGLGTYLSLIIVFIIYVGANIRNKKSDVKLTLSLLCGWLTILVTNFFGFSTTTIQLFFYLIPALIISSMNPLSKFDKESTSKLSFFQKLFSFILLSLTVYLLFSIVVYYLADVDYSYGTKYAKIMSQEKAAEYFEKALKLRDEPVYEDRFSNSLSYLAAVAALQNQKDLAKQIAVLSDSYNRKTIKIYPRNVFYWKTRAKNMYYFYQVTGNQNELLQGAEALKTARSLYPTDPKIPYSLALYYSILYDSTQNNADKQNWQKLSLEEIEKTIKLKSNYREAYLFKGQLLKKYGQIDNAKKVFEYMLNNFNANDQEVIKEIQSL
jgi:O-antigen ligase